MSILRKASVTGLLFVALMTFVLPVIFAGAGYLLSLVLPFSAFQCSVLSLISALLGTVVFFAVSWTPVDSLLHDKLMAEKIERCEKLDSG